MEEFCLLFICVLAPLPSFSEQSLLFEGAEMLCSAVFVSVVRQKKALYVEGFTVSDARKGKGTSLFDIFFPHAPLAGRCTRKIKDNSDPLFCLFCPESCLNMGTLFLRPFDLLLRSRTILQHGNNAARSLPQNWACDKLFCAVHTVCMIKACSQECLSTALFFLHVQHVVGLWNQMGKLLLTSKLLVSSQNKLNLPQLQGPRQKKI